MTKGSKQRPYDKDKFDKNFEKIFENKKKKNKKKEGKST
jgi:hypothetical protein|tara:strand:- start:579 stop:695 length:117 start_codon:yes stop_codon:yes gene_type:complete